MWIAVAKKKTHPSLRFILLVGLFFALAAWVDAASNPLESLSISAPNCPSADIVHGVGSDSWIHSSCVSMVVKSVSVEAAEWAAWTGVDCFDRVAISSFLQVHLLSVKTKLSECVVGLKIWYLTKCCRRWISHPSAWPVGCPQVLPLFC